MFLPPNLPSHSRIHMLHEDLNLLPESLTCLTSDSQRTLCELQTRGIRFENKGTVTPQLSGEINSSVRPRKEENKARRGALSVTSLLFSACSFLCCLYFTGFPSWWLPWVSLPKFPLHVFNSLLWQGCGRVDTASQDAWKERIKRLNGR